MNTYLAWIVYDTALFCIVCSVVSSYFIATAQHTAPAAAVRKLDLPVGFRFSFSSLVDANNRTTAVEAYDSGIYKDNIFFPVLSTPAFYNVSGQGPGFSLGLLYSPAQYLDFYFDVAFLAICGGVSPENSTANYSSNYYTSMSPQNDTSYSVIEAYPLSRSFVVPLWVANWDAPLINVFRNASLVVVKPDGDNLNGSYSGGGTNNTTTELQLRNDADGSVMWRMRNVGSLEILDNGTVLVYSHSLIDIESMAAADSLLVQKLGTTTDILFSNQRLTSETELRTNGSDISHSYSARIFPEGLGLYNNSLEPTVPYLFYPFNTRNGTVDPLGKFYSSNSSSACKNGSVYIPDEFGMLLDPGLSTCSNDEMEADLALFITPRYYRPLGTVYLYMFMRLETDGRFYISGVSYDDQSSNNLFFTDRAELDSYILATRSNTRTVTGSFFGWNITFNQPNATYISFQALTGQPELPYNLVYPQSKLWGPNCDLPAYCGPLGVCNASAIQDFQICTCPFLHINKSSGDSNQELVFLNPTDPIAIKGCTRDQSLPDCTETNSSVTSDYEFVFRELNQATTIFTFSGLTSAELSYYNITGTPEDCTQICKNDCFCQGFLFVRLTSSLNGRCHLIPRDYAGGFLDMADDLHYNTYDNLTTKSISPSNYSVFLKFVIPKNSGSKISNKAIIAISATISISVVLLIAGLATAYLLVNSRKSNSKLRAVLGALRLVRGQAVEEELEMELQEILPSLLTRFSYDDLVKATSSFSKLLGAGGCGSVYKGQLTDGRIVAVKVLESSVLTKVQIKQFLTELACVGQTSHSNIVQLIGFCWEYAQRLLVYEYVEGGSLDQWIFNNNTEVLDWVTRYNIAVGIVRGLHYLHEECRQPILHFDVKPQNILLNKQKVPKLADFGLSKLMQSNDISHVVTGVRGTPGYIAPEWLSHGAVSKKTDIYSLGMVFLELVGGRRNIELSFLHSDDKQLVDCWYFPSWAAMNCRQGSMLEIIDKDLQVGYDEEQVQTLIFTAFWCIDPDPQLRPNIKSVMLWLEGTSLVPTPNFFNVDIIGASQSKFVKPPHIITLTQNEYSSQYASTTSSTTQNKNLESPL